MTRTEFTTSLRLMADFWEQHEEMPVPRLGKMFDHWTYDKEELAAIIKCLGSVRKRFGNGWAEIETTIGHISFSYTISREKVCTRRVVSVERVEEELIPSRLVPAHDREIVEWDCHPLLAGEDE